MYNDPYNPELDPSKNPELAGEQTNEIAPDWEAVAAEADSPDAPPAIGSPDSYRSPEHLRHGTIGEDLDALRNYINHENPEDEDINLSENIDGHTDVDPVEENTNDKSPDSPSEKLDEAEVEARLRDYINSLESEYNNVRNMSNDGLRRRINEEKLSLEQQLSGPEANEDHSIRIDLAVRRRAEAIIRENDNMLSSY